MAPDDRPAAATEDARLAADTFQTAGLDRQQMAERLQAARAEQRWQRAVLPFMMVGLLLAALFFGWTTYSFFDRLQAELAYAKSEPFGLINRVDASPQGASDPAYRDWAVRATLEQAALQQRFNVQVAIVKGRLWARFMGFLTGMILALTGCVFVLGKLRTDIDFQGQTAGASAVLKTTSPGVYLALLGTVIIGMALAVPGSVEGTDAAVYLARTTPAPVAGAVTTPPVPLPDSGAPVAGTAPAPFPSPFAADQPASR